jgi:hypothetical protein
MRSHIFKYCTASSPFSSFDEEPKTRKSNYKTGQETYTMLTFMKQVGILLLRSIYM